MPGFLDPLVDRGLNPLSNRVEVAPARLPWYSIRICTYLLVWLFRVDIEQEYQIYNHPKVGRIDFLPSSLSKISRLYSICLTINPHNYLI